MRLEVFVEQLRRAVDEFGPEFNSMLRREARQATNSASNAVPSFQHQDPTPSLAEALTRRQSRNTSPKHNYVKLVHMPLDSESNSSKTPWMLKNLATASRC